MAKLKRQRVKAQSQYEKIIGQQVEILAEIKPVQRSLIDFKKSSETSRVDSIGGQVRLI